MATLEHYTLIFTAIYTVALIGIAWWSYRIEPKSHQGFIIGNRAVGVWGTLSSLAAGQFSGAVIFIFFAMAPIIGYGLMWMPFGATAGLLLLRSRLNDVVGDAKQHDYVTLTDFLKQRIGPKTANLATVVVCLKAFLLIASQLYLAGNIFAVIFHTPPLYTILAIAFGVMVYLWLGGYLTVIRTDVLQIILLLLTIVVPLLFFGLPANHSIGVEIVNVGVKPLGLFVFILLMVYSNAEMWQRMFSIKNTETGKKAFAWSGAMLMVLVFCTVSFALIIYANVSNLTPGKGAFFQIFVQSAIAPAFLGLLCVFLIAAIMSTVDTQVYLASATLTKNVLKIGDRKSHQQFVNYTRVIMVIMLVVLAVVAATIGDILEFIFKAVSIGFVLIPALIFSQKVRAKTSESVDIITWYSVLVGLAVYIYMFFSGYFVNPLNTAIPPMIGLLTLAMLAWRTKAKSE